MYFTTIFKSLIFKDFKQQFGKISFINLNLITKNYLFVQVLLNKSIFFKK